MNVVAIDSLDLSFFNDYSTNPLPTDTVLYLLNDTSTKNLWKFPFSSREKEYFRSSGLNDLAKCCYHHATLKRNGQEVRRQTRRKRALRRPIILLVRVLRIGASIVPDPALWRRTSCR
jgi:hypothetical protein